MTITAVIPTYGGNDPNRISGRATFVTDMASTLSYMNGLSPYYNSMATQANALAVTVNGYRDEALSFAERSEAAMVAALSYTTATEWVAGTYSHPAAVIHPDDGNVYICMGVDVTSNPIGAAQTDWLPKTTTKVLPEIKTGSFTAEKDVFYQLDTRLEEALPIMPAALSPGDSFYFVDYARTFEDFAAKIDMNGHNLEGLDLTGDFLEMTDNGAKVKLMYIDATIGLRIA